MDPNGLTPHDLLLWSLLVGVVGLIAMGVDKAMAMWWDDRISERTLWITALAGGFWGVVLGAFMFHHKTSKSSFWGPVVLATVLWTSVLFLVLSGLVRL